ncbi:MAG: hypothetical protein QF760_02290 [Candidatus Thalassarchaeaceae archaeon]|jgi:hypothetical protein|nr:hypothetical protein [Candidatus Thalassarchaeaceae archaeon]MDP6703339.1 hypothetical protein [Candidatus Thalassarchaeaceae archaeon]MDP7004110.1 hypothetical protein [Candidatus Thalassarchaeaceae archaeon]
MPTCRMCKQNYPESQFIGGIGPRHLVCARCGIEHGLANPEDVPQYYSDDIINARFALFTLRHLPWSTLLFGWLLYLSLGRGIELWSSIFFVVLVLGTLVVPVIHFLRSTRFKAELSRLTP